MMLPAPPCRPARVCVRVRVRVRARARPSPKAFGRMCAHIHMDIALRTRLSSRRPVLLSPRARRERSGAERSGARGADERCRSRSVRGRARSRPPPARRPWRSGTTRSSARTAGRCSRWRARRPRAASARARRASAVRSPHGDDVRRHGAQRMRGPPLMATVGDAGWWWQSWPACASPSSAPRRSWRASSRCGRRCRRPGRLADARQLTTAPGGRQVELQQVSPQHGGGGCEAGREEAATTVRQRATVDDDCPKCGHRGLEYYTMQVREAGRRRERGGLGGRVIHGDGALLPCGASRSCAQRTRGRRSSTSAPSAGTSSRSTPRQQASKGRAEREREREGGRVALPPLAAWTASDLFVVGLGGCGEVYTYVRTWMDGWIEAH
eukprot:scaffold314_cov562-Prasinococcus_capsulatus_cf.AAC.1